MACERVLVLSAGRLVFDGEPQELAQRAMGRVWEVRSAPDEALDLPAGAILADEAAAADGSYIRRIIAEESPDPRAKQLEASLEDGYLWSLRDRLGEPGASPA